ncbi:MAG: hypothetical protein HZC55_26985 [Verrucomicrobia bacterium]|nr:hypothetical protein [Verrucomicrobiota bacterium]
MTPPDNVPAQGPPPRPRALPWRWATAVLALVAVLSLPEPLPPPPAGAGRPVFAWRQDEVWRALEQKMLGAHQAKPSEVDRLVADGLAQLSHQLQELRQFPRAPDDPLLGALERTVFELAPLVAARPGNLAPYLESVAALRREVKQHSRNWDLNSLPARQRLYRLLYGSRLAVEEVLLQLPEGTPWTELQRHEDPPSATPSVTLLGVTVHSGDLLVSRGGAPTSALISRGNDYPGAFSHVALLHVDPVTRVPSVIESHIEQGVAISSLEAYLRDPKLRILILRLRPDLPALVSDPQLPHRAASAALTEARTRHIPYDFAMNHRDPAAQFCSEVASAAYDTVGLRLWMGMSFLSDPTVTSWLGSIGVRHFETQEPADLEYDSQLTLVAEWRQRSTLFKGHVDDAVTDVLFEESPRGAPLPYSVPLLPFARLSKAWSWGLNQVGRLGPIPEGMSATAALRVSRYRSEHATRVDRVLRAAEDFRRTRGYLPPYWELVRLARETRNRGQ